MINRYVRPFINSIKAIVYVSQYQLKTNFGVAKKHLSPKLFNSMVLNRTYGFSQQKSQDQNQQFKNESKQFYQNYVQDIIELQKSADWAMVISNTAQPMVIDFYADWCEPCKKLTPILEERIKKTQGKVKLLKVNIDKCGQLAHQLRITSVPTVFAVFRGQGIDSFQGLPQSSKIDKLFETLDKVANIANTEDKAYEILSQGKQLLAEQNFAQAQKKFAEFSQKGVDEQLVALKQVLLAQCLLSQQKITKFRDQLQRIKKYQKYYIQNPQLKDFYELIIKEGQKISQMSKQNPQIASLKIKVQSSPNDLESMFKLSQAYKNNDMIQESLQTLIEIMRIDRTWEDKKANKMMLAIFKELGNNSPLTQKYRKIMQRILY